MPKLDGAVAVPEPEVELSALAPAGEACAPGCRSFSALELGDNPCRAAFR